MNKITKSFLMLLLLGAGAVSAQAQDDWFNDELYRFRQEKKNEGDPGYDAILSNKSKVTLSADPADATNQCIKVVAAQNATATTSQLWIRGAEVGGEGFAEGQGCRITMRVKADGNYEVSTTAHRNWGWFTSAGFGKVNVTEEWTTVSLLCVATNQSATFTDLCLDMSSADGPRTFYIDDIQIVRGSAWYLNNEFHAKDYLDPDAKYGPDTDNPYPSARFVSDADGGYVEVISNAGASNPYESQLWIAIPEKYVGSNTKMTMEVQASKAITVSESFQATATGKGWGSSASPGSGLSFTVGEWVPVTRILKTKDAKSGAASAWGPGYPDQQVDQYCLDLSESTGDKEAITYKFRNVKFEDAEESWTETMAYRVKVTPFTQDPDDATKWIKGADENSAPEYSFGTGGEEGGYFEVTAAGKHGNPYDTQFFFQIADVAPDKALKVNETVTLSFKIKALPNDNLEEGQEVELGGGFHKSFDGAGWLSPAPASKIKVGEWTTVEQTFEIANADITNYSIDLSQDAAAITYQIDEVSATWEEAPILDWVELIPAGDCETEAEHAFVAAKQMPKGQSDPCVVSTVAGVGVEDGNGIEVVAGDKVANPWDSQFFIYEPYALPGGTKIIVEFDCKAENEASVGTQSHNAPGDYLHYAAIGNVAFTTEWKHFKYEGTVASQCDNNGTARFHSIAFNLNDFDKANTYYFDNISFKVPAGTIDEIDPVYIDDLVDPASLDWSDNLLKNGDLEGEDMSEFVLKNNDVENPETLLAEAKVVKESNQIQVKVASRTEDEGEVVGNEWDSQLWLRLPYALPKGTKYYLAFDYNSNKVVDISTQTHGEPGAYLSSTGIGKVTTAAAVQRFEIYATADADMRSIAFNLAVAEAGATYNFDNFEFKLVTSDIAAVQEFTTTWDATSLWAETLALNEAAFAGRNIETEGYTEESVKALTDAIAAGKAELENKEADAESLTAAKKAIEDAIAGLEEAVVLEDTDLTAEMFFNWDGVDATAVKTGSAGCAYDVNVTTDMPYGDGTVNEYNYADLSAYDHLVITATEGEPRLLFNRAAQDDHQGPLSVELPRDKGENKYEVVIDNGDGTTTYVINLKAIVEKDGYAHLHAIKGANWQKTTVTEMKLFVGESEYTDALTGIEGVAETAASAKDAKYFINGQIVIVKNGVKYNAAGQVIK